MKNKSIKDAKEKGRNGDDHLAHLQTGEMIVPPVLSEDTMERLYAEMLAAGIDPNEYTVGGEMSINPATGLPEFGFGKSISKGFKKITKSVKKVISSPIGSIGLGLALPGIGSALGAGLGLGSLAGTSLAGAGIGALSGGGLKGALGGGLAGFGAGGGGGILGGALGAGSGVAGKTLGGALLGTAGGALGGGDLKSSILAGGVSGLGALYNSGGFKNLGGAFKQSGLSGALSQFGDNLSGAGDVLQATGGAGAKVAGGGGSVYNNSTDTGESMFSKLTSGRGLSSVLNGGIGIGANTSAANDMLDMQKKGLSALQPYLNFQYTPQDLENDPGYQFQLDQGQKARDRASASRGSYFSGDALRAAGEYATGLADQTYNQGFNRALSSNQQNINNVLAQYGIYGDIGNTKAAKTIGNANVLTDSISNILAPKSGYEELLERLLG